MKIVREKLTDQNRYPQRWWLAVLLVVAFLAGCSESEPPEQPPVPTLQKSTASAEPLPESTSPVEFTVATDDGQMPVSKFRGDVVYLDFWATWCGPCRDSFPWMREMQTKYRDKGLTVLAVSLDTDRVLARQFADELESNFIIGYDDSGSIADMFKVKGMPTSVVINRDGTVSEIHQGFNLTKLEEYEASLEKVLN